MWLLYNYSYAIITMFFITFVKPPIILRFLVNFSIVFLVSSFYDPYAYPWRKDFFVQKNKLADIS